MAPATGEASSVGNERYSVGAHERNRVNSSVTLCTTAGEASGDIRAYAEVEVRTGNILTRFATVTDQLAGFDGNSRDDPSDKAREVFVFEAEPRADRAAVVYD